MRAYPTITEIVSHHEAYQRGYGSGHNDPDNWWPKHGLSMDKLRAKVAELLATGAQQPAQPQPPADTEQLYRVRKSWPDKASHTGAYKSLENAKNACAEGNTVSEKAGTAVFSRSETEVKVDPAMSRGYQRDGT